MVEDYCNKVAVEMETVVVVVEILYDMSEVVVVDDGNNLVGEVEKAVVDICNNVEEVVMVMEVEVIYNSDGIAEEAVEVIYNSNDVVEEEVGEIYNSNDVAEEVVEATVAYNGMTKMMNHQYEAYNQLLH